jgi:threonine dehydrogenase-like Zn-dependent dehydrogenase
MVEYLSVPSAALVHGRGLGYDRLALIEPLAIGAHAVRRATIRPGEFALIVGAGPIGLGIFESVRLAGGEPIVMDVNERRLAFCRDRLNAIHAIDAKNDPAGQLQHITRGDMPTVVFDATGSLKAIEQAFQYPAHGGRYILVGLQKGEIRLSHPEFHKRELTLMSSRNATREDFDSIMEALEKGLIDPDPYITHRTSFARAGAEFTSWLDPGGGVIKAMIEIDN